MSLTVVIPAFNEGANVSAVVELAIASLQGNSWIGPWEIVVVDDGSTDDTAAHARGCDRPGVALRVISHAGNQGLGAALLTGYAAAAGERLTYVPGDGEIGIDEAIRLVRDMGSADLMISTRVRTASSGRWIATWVLHGLLRLTLGFDPNIASGIYVIHRDVFRSLPLVSRTGLVNLEIPMRCIRAGLSIQSGVIQVSPRISGTSKVANLRTMLAVFWEMFKLRLVLAWERR